MDNKYYFCHDYTAPVAAAPLPNGTYTHWFGLGNSFKAENTTVTPVQVYRILKNGAVVQRNKTFAIFPSFSISGESEYANNTEFETEQLALEAAIEYGRKLNTEMFHQRVKNVTRLAELRKAKEEAAKPKPRRLVVGEHVIVLMEGETKTGLIAEDDGTGIPFRIRLDDDGNDDYGDWFYEEDVKARFMFRKGDKVRISNGAEEFGGEIGTVSYIDAKDCYQTFQVTVPCGEAIYFSADELELVKE